jgi:DNA polymerase-3 subunit delta
MFYVFHGDDEHSKKKYLNQLIQKLGDPTMVDLNTSRFEGNSLTLSELRHACDSVPFLSDRRVVIVNDLLVQEPDFIDDLLAYVRELPETTRLVFLESRLLPNKDPVVGLAKQMESGYVKSFKRLEGRDLAFWIQNQVAEEDGAISPRAAHLLAVNVGNDLALLENEIEKLLRYKDGETIEAEDVALLCSYVAEASIFDFVDALGSRHGRTAGELLQRKLDEGTEPAYLYAMIVRQFRLLIQVKELFMEGYRQTDIAQRLNIHGFVSGKLIQQSRNYQLRQLEEIYAHLLDMDLGVKTGKTDMITALDLLVAGLVN